MLRMLRKLVVVLAVSVLFLAGVDRVAAQAVIVTPAPRVSYYYAPPVVSYYTAPAVTYYAAPAVRYYTPPVVSYYTPPAVSYYAAPAATVTTYRYGLLPSRQVTVTTYGAPAV